MNFIPCITWIPKGVAKSVPYKVQLTEKELEKIIKQTKDELSDEDFDDEEDADFMDEDEDSPSEVKAKLEDEESEEEEETDNKPSHADLNDELVKQELHVDKNIKIKSADEEIDHNGDSCSENSDEEGKKEISDQDLSEYEFDKYDEEEGGADAVFGLANLTVHASNTSDPYVTLKEDKDDDDSEKDNFEIKPTDNLLVVGHVHDDASILEIHVFNEEEESFYVHHDILLPAFPLCLEWLNFDPGDSSRGNLVAVGSMSSVIDVWDMDIVDCLEPTFRLGKKAKLKKGKPGYGHHDAVLDLSWNANFSHVMASGSVDKTVILWDLETCSVASSLQVFKDKVQTLTWHPFEAQTLLAGSTDKSVRVFDCRADNSSIKWKFPGEIERVLWNHFDPFCYFASTDVGTVHYVDCRNSKPLWQLKAHNKEVTGIGMSHQCPGMLVTASADRSVKVWDMSSPDGSGQSSGGPLFISEMEDFGIGAIHCGSFCPDSAFVMCAGGDKKSNNVRVWHAAENSAVRKRFFNRPLVKLEKVGNTSTSESKEKGSVSTEAASLGTMETENALSALESMSINKKSSKKHVNKHKIKKKKKPKFKH